MSCQDIQRAVSRCVHVPRRYTTQRIQVSIVTEVVPVFYLPCGHGLLTTIAPFGQEGFMMVPEPQYVNSI